MGVFLLGDTHRLGVRQLQPRVAVAGLQQSHDDRLGARLTRVIRQVAAGDTEAVIAEFDKVWLPKAPVLAELRKVGATL
jgi:hypothetical protein